MTLAEHFPATGAAIERLRNELKLYREQKAVARYVKTVRRAMVRVPQHLPWDERARAILALMDAQNSVNGRDP